VKTNSPRKKSNGPVIATVLGVIVFGALAVWFIRHVVTSSVPQAKKVVQEVHLIRPPPPPPDEPPPPPPPPEEKVNIPDPQEKPEEPTPSNDPPPSENLGLDTEGGAGGDAFGLVGNKGGRDLVGSGPGGSVYQWYAGLLKNEISDQLGANKKVRSSSFKTALKVWLRRDGSVERVVIAPTGDKERDHVIEAEVLKIRLSQPPPADMPNPVNISIASHS
jgi:periplasmic protein TonB